MVTSYTPHTIKVGSATCGTAPGNTWHEALASESKKAPDLIDECAYAYTTTAKAHAEFLRDVASFKQERRATKALKEYKQVAIPTIGNESAAWGVGRSGTYVFFVLFFRQGTTEVFLTYGGIHLLAAGTLTHIGSAIAARVAAGTSKPSGVPPAPLASAHLPAAVRRACSQERGLRSLNSSVATWLRFKNLGPRPVAIFWLDYSGHRVMYQDVKPKATWLEQTYATHAWVAASVPGNRCKVIFVASAGATEADIH